MTYHCFLLSQIFQSFMPVLWVQTKAAMVSPGIMADHWFNTHLTSDEIKNDCSYTSMPLLVCLYVMCRDNFIFFTVCLTLLQSYKKRGVQLPHFLKCVSDILNMFNVFYDQVLNEQMKNILHQMTSRSNVSECQVILMWALEGDDLTL
jgi:hypothetical protein